MADAHPFVGLIVGGQVQPGGGPEAELLPAAGVRMRVRTLMYAGAVHCAVLQPSGAGALHARGVGRVAACCLRHSWACG
jgi:hypothetical protein